MKARCRAVGGRLTRRGQADETPAASGGRREVPRGREGNGRLTQGRRDRNIAGPGRTSGKKRAKAVLRGSAGGWPRDCARRLAATTAMRDGEGARGVTVSRPGRGVTDAAQGRRTPSAAEEAGVVGQKLQGKPIVITGSSGRIGRRAAAVTCARGQDARGGRGASEGAWRTGRTIERAGGARAMELDVRRGGVPRDGGPVRARFEARSTGSVRERGLQEEEVRRDRDDRRGGATCSR